MAMKRRPVPAARILAARCVTRPKAALRRCRRRAITRARPERAVVVRSAAAMETHDPPCCGRFTNVASRGQRQWGPPPPSLRRLRAAAQRDQPSARRRYGVTSRLVNALRQILASTGCPSEAEDENASAEPLPVERSASIALFAAIMMGQSYRFPRPGTPFDTIETTGVVAATVVAVAIDPVMPPSPGKYSIAPLVCSTPFTLNKRLIFEVMSATSNCVAPKVRETPVVAV